MYLDAFSFPYMVRPIIGVLESSNVGIEEAAKTALQLEYILEITVTSGMTALGRHPNRGTAASSRTSERGDRTHLTTPA